MAEEIAVTSVESGLGLLPRAVGPEGVVLRMPLTGSLGPDGQVHNTALSVVADAAAGLGVSVFNSGRGGVTADLRVDRIGPVGARARYLEAIGTCIGIDGDLAYGRVEIRDDLGNLLGHGISVMVLDSPATPGHETSSTVVGRFDLNDVRVERTAEHVSVGVVTPGMANRRGAVHGGVVMGLAHEAQDMVHVEHGVRFRRLGLSVDYLRPAPVGMPLSMHSAFVRRGRRLWTIRTEVRAEGGRTVAVATGMSAIGAGGDTV